MSIPGLFIPTYGKQAEQTSGRPKAGSRPIPTKGDSTKPSFNNKRSLMPSLVFNGNIDYIQTFEAAEKAARALEEARPEVLGFDIEWQVSFVSGQAPRPTATLQLCVPDNHTRTAAARGEAPHNLVSTPSSNSDSKPSLSESSGQEQPQQDQKQHQHQRPSSSVWGTAYVFHLCHMRGHPSALGESARAAPSPPKQPGATIATCKTSSSSSSSSGSSSGRKRGDSTGQESHCSSPEVVVPETAAYLPDALVRVLSDPGILLAGVGVGGDVSRLEREYEQLRVGGVNGVVDLSELAKRKVTPDRRRRGMWSLADLCAELLGLQLRKPSSLRTGNWEKRSLDVDQLFYAAADAYAGVRLWQVLHEMPDLVLQRSNANGLRDNSNNASSDTNTTVPASSKGNAGRKTVATPATAEGGKMAAGSEAENKAPASAPSRATPRLPLSKLETYRLWHEDGLSIEAVAEVRPNKTTTVLGYISDCIEAGMPYEPERLGIDSPKEKRILAALFAATEGDKPATILEESSQQRTKSEAPDKHTVEGPTPTSESGRAPNLCDTVRASSSIGVEASALQAPMIGPPVRASISPAVSSGRAGSGCDVAVWAEAELDRRSAEGAGARHADGDVVNFEASENRGSLNTHGGNAGGATLAGSEERCNGTSVAGRWEAVRLKEVKTLAADAEYWEIRIVLARLRSGWSANRT